MVRLRNVVRKERAPSIYVSLTVSRVAAEMIFTILEPAAKASAAVREGYIPDVLDRHRHVTFCWTNAIRVLDFLMQTEEDVETFCKSQGMEVVSQLWCTVQGAPAARAGSVDTSNSVFTKETRRSVTNALHLFRRATSWVVRHREQSSAQVAIRGWVSMHKLMDNLHILMERCHDNNVLTATYAVLNDMWVLNDGCVLGTLSTLRQVRLSVYVLVLLCGAHMANSITSASKIS